MRIGQQRLHAAAGWHGVEGARGSAAGCTLERATAKQCPGGAYGVIESAIAIDTDVCCCETPGTQW